MKKVQPTKAQLQEFYKTNQDFHNYVDKYIKNKDLTVSDALELALIKEVYELYVDNSNRIQLTYM